jgi:hypothetical protein
MRQKAYWKYNGNFIKYKGNLAIFYFIDLRY